jgi:hypothetical protein
MIKKWYEFLVENNKYDFGCVMIKVPIKNWDKVLDEIDPSDVYEVPNESYGLQLNPHVTILYGFGSDINLNDIKKKLNQYSPVEVIINGIEVFENDEFDVVKFGVKKTDQLESMFNSLSELPNENQFPEYLPHITIAYVKKGSGEKYKKLMNKNLGKLDIIEFSNSKGKQIFKLSDQSSSVD